MTEIQNREHLDLGFWKLFRVSTNIIKSGVLRIYKHNLSKCCVLITLIYTEDIALFYFSSRAAFSEPLLKPSKSSVTYKNPKSCSFWLMVFRCCMAKPKSSGTISILAVSP